jgi:hypothetical protein
VGCHNEHNLCSSCELPFSRIEGHVQHQQLGGRLPVPCSVCQSEFDRVQTEDFACRIWEQLKNAHAGNTQVQTQLFATYGREYDNFTHLHGESIDAMFQRFMVIVNHMRANVVVLSYDDHDRAIKLLHSLYRTVWSEKVETFLSRRSMRPSRWTSCFPSSSHPRWIVGCVQISRTRLTIIVWLSCMDKVQMLTCLQDIFLSCLVCMPDEEFDVLGEEELMLLSRRFERM